GDGIEYFLGKGCYPAHALSRRGRLRSEAGKWIFDEAAAGPFSFNWICDGLEIGQSYLRAGITRVFETVEALPHWPENFLPTGCSAPHFEQRNGAVGQPPARILL